MDNWSQEQMLEVVLKEPDDFLKVRETLSRMGVAYGCCIQTRENTMAICTYTS